MASYFAGAIQSLPLCARVKWPFMGATKTKENLIDFLSGLTSPPHFVEEQLKCVHNLVPITNSIIKIP